MKIPMSPMGTVSHGARGWLPLVVLLDEGEVSKLDSLPHRDGVADLASSYLLELDS
jgi:hypothetical protein